MAKAIQRALISVSDKTNIIEFAAQLNALKIEIISTGGTAKLLKQHAIPVIEIADYTGFPEMMDGRVKTLHPKVHGGLLGRRDIDDEIMKSQQISCIDLLVVNLYPFSQTIAKENCSLNEAIEQIDIGGPAMLRSAAKNFQDVTVVVDPQDYLLITDELKNHHKITTLDTRYYLAKKVFAHTAAYDGAIANYLGKTELNGTSALFPETFTLQLQKKQEMRYGENPHQQAAFYVEFPYIPGSIANAQQLQGKPLSFNNVADADAALRAVKRFSEPACVIVKHANPCGIALGDSQLAAYHRAFATDPTSAFGGIIAFNKTLTTETAETILAQQFVEAIIAPDVDENALKVLAAKPNIRVLSCGTWRNDLPSWDFQRVMGGLLIQEQDSCLLTPDQIKVVTKRTPTEKELHDLLFAWEVVKEVKSNAIVYVKDKATIGIGAGQMSRVFSAKIALMKAEEAGLSAKNSVMASDAFFPFRDGIDVAAQAGITAIIQPGGSMRDEEVIQAANEANIAMVFTGFRHFRH